jgi:hypothetical protein
MKRRRDRFFRNQHLALGLIGPPFCRYLHWLGDRFMRDTQRFRVLSEQTLARILELNGRTAWGRDHDLDGPSPRQVFDSLPTTTYADYVPYVDRIAAGEPNVMTADPVVSLAMTSGTTGPPKLIPVTQRKSRLTGKILATGIGMALRGGELKTMRGPFMTIMTEHESGTTDGGIPIGAATTGGYKRMGRVAELIFSSPPAVARIADQASARYLHMLFALREERLWTIVAFFPATLLFALRHMHEQVDSLLRDLGDGTISRDLNITAEMRAELQRRLTPQPRRARNLRRLFDGGRFGVSDIWTDMGAVLTVTGGAFRFYADQLQPFLGDAKVFSPIYSASEGTFGFGYSCDEPFYLLLPILNYIELLPVENADEASARPIPAWQAEPGREYETVITTFAGLVRYRLHDIVRVVRFQGETPIIEFIERCGQVVDIVGEKTAEHHVVAAIDAACQTLDQSLVDYVIGPDSEHTPARYALAIEEWQGDSRDHTRARGFVRAVDAALRRIAPDYDEECQLGTLAPMSIVLLRAGAFERLREKGVASGGAASQIKTPHVVPDPGFITREFGRDILMRD